MALGHRCFRNGPKPNTSGRSRPIRASRHWPGETSTLRQGARVIEDSRRAIGMTSGGQSAERSHNHRLPNHEVRIARFRNGEGHPGLGMSTFRDTVGGARRALL
jgi:hypothetical protein